MGRNPVRWLFGLCLLLLPASSFAQDSAIAGTVRDTTGALLPGVTVEASSPALIEKVRTVVTDERGEYRIIDLRPGTYTVTFALAGFSNVRREGIELTSAFTASINAELRVGSVEETITVSGAAPIVDVQSTVRARVVTKDVIDAIPAQKNWNGIGVLTVGVVSNQMDVGGSAAEHQNQISIHGGSYTDNIRTLDGMMLSNMACNYSCTGLSSNDASTQELTYEISAMSAEVGGGGIRINIIPRDGGNQFSGSAFSNIATSAMQANNFTTELKNRGITAVDSIDKIYDSSVGLGGPIKRDKLWFFASTRYWGSSIFRSNDYWAQDPFAIPYVPDLSRQAIDDQWNLSSDLRLTWQMSPKNRLAAYYNYAPRQTNHWNTNSLRPPEASQLQRVHLNHFETVVFRSTLSSKALFEAGFGNMTEDWTREPIPDGPSSLGYSVLEQATGVNYRAYNLNFSHNLTDVRSYRTSLAYVTGSHAFKVGMVMMNGNSSTPQWHGPITRGPGELGDIALNFLNSVPVSVTVFATPFTTLENLNYDLGLYVQDQWTLNRLTVNAAVRFDFMKQSIPEQVTGDGTWVAAQRYAALDNVPNWKDVGPRLGLNYDVFGNGRTSVKATLSRYVQTNTVGFARLVNPINTSVNSTTRAWTDSNNDRVPQLNELGALANRNFGQSNPLATVYDDSLIRGWRVRPGNWEWSAGVQHQLLPRVGLDVGFFHRSYFNFYATQNEALTPDDFQPYSVVAPVDPALGSASGATLTGFYDVVPSKFGLVQNRVYNYDRFGDGKTVFDGVDVQATARLGAGAFFGGGFSTGRLAYSFCANNFVGTVSGVALPGAGGVTATPSFSLPNVRFCDVSFPFQTQYKLMGSYNLPFDVQLSGSFQSYPGPTIGATWNAPASAAQTSLGRPLSGGVRTVSIPILAPGELFEVRRNQLDLRVARNFRVGAKRLQVMVDMYNMFNSNALTNVNNTYGPLWLQPQNIIQARFFKVGGQFTF